MDRRLASVIGYTVTVAWAASFGVSILRPTYSPPASVHALMMLVAGAAFGVPLIKRNGKDGGA